MAGDRDKILKELKEQEKRNGKSDEIEILRRFAKIVKWGRQWSSFVKCKYIPYGKMSYECHREYVATPELLELMKQQ
jgi:hypothetical protein